MNTKILIFSILIYGPIMVMILAAPIYKKISALRNPKETNIYASTKIPKDHDGRYCDMSLFFIHDKNLGYAWREISVSDQKGEFIVLGFVLHIDDVERGEVVRHEKMIWDGEIRRATYRNLFQISSLNTPYYFLHAIDGVHRAYVVHPKVPDEAQLLREVHGEKQLVFSHEYEDFNDGYQHPLADKHTYLYVTTPGATEPIETYLINFAEGHGSATWQPNAPNALNEPSEALNA